MIFEIYIKVLDTIELLNIGENYYEAKYTKKYN